MSKKITSLVAVVAVGLFACSASAGCPNCAAHAGAGATKTGDKPCHKAAGKPCGGSHAAHAGHKQVKTVAGDAGIEERIEAALATVPKMLYRIGDETTCCSKSAAGIAKKTGKPIMYVIGEDVIADETEAKVKLTALLEKELESLNSLQFTAGGKCMKCPVTAKKLAKDTETNMAYRVAGFDFADKEVAEKTVKLTVDAAKSVKLSYKVDGQSFCCDKMAGAKAKETGKPIVYVVGEEETPCKKTADLLFTQAKIHAVVAAAVALAL